MAEGKHRPMAVGIGERNEGSLHRALKARYAASGGPGAMEQPVDGFIADVVAGGRLIEIHTGGFAPLKRKLAQLIERHPVTLVHPIARHRYLLRPPQDGAAAPTRRRSPKHGSVFSVFAPLASIPRLLGHPNLTLHVVLIVEEAVQRWEPSARRGRGGWVTEDRRLVEVLETRGADSMADLFALVDAALPERFTTEDLAAAMGVSRRLAQQAAFCLRESGVSTLCGKRGNARIYRRAAGSALPALSSPPASPVLPIR